MTKDELRNIYKNATEEVIGQKGTISVKLTYKNPYLELDVYFHILASPTHNCQVMSIASAEKFLAPMWAEGIFDKDASLYDLLLGISAISQVKTKKLCIFDIHRNYVNYLKRYFLPSGILVNSPYISTNGSRMNLLLVNLNMIVDPNETSKS